MKKETFQEEAPSSARPQANSSGRQSPSLLTCDSEREKERERDRWEEL